MRLKRLAEDTDLFHACHARSPSLSLVRQIIFAHNRSTNSAFFPAVIMAFTGGSKNAKPSVQTVNVSVPRTQGGCTPSRQPYSKVDDMSESDSEGDLTPPTQARGGR